MTDLYESTYLTLRSQLKQNKRLLDLLNTMNKERQELKEIVQMVLNDDFQNELKIFCDSDGRMITLEFREFMDKLKKILGDKIEKNL